MLYTTDLGVRRNTDTFMYIDVHILLGTHLMLHIHVLELHT